MQRTVMYKIINILIPILSISIKVEIIGGEFYEKYCDNPYYFNRQVLQNIHKCYCEPYRKAELDANPSIVRFPVNNCFLNY